MARTKYSYQKRQKELAKQKKKEEKRQRKLARKDDAEVSTETTEGVETPEGAVAEAPLEPEKDNSDVV